MHYGQKLVNKLFYFKLKKIIDSGELVSDKILNQIISERIEENDCKRGFILDGYPRTMTQVFFFNNLLVKKNLKVNCIFEFSIDDQTILNRIIGRAATENRGDDSETSIKTRLLKYYQETKPVSDFYKTEFNSIYHLIDGNLEIAKLNLELLKLAKKQ